MWIYRTGKIYKDTPIVLYEYQRTRKADHPREFLKGFTEVVACDGYSAYKKLDRENPDITFAGCWIHIRRYFIDAVPKGKQYAYSQPAVQGVQYCNRLFAIKDSINKKYPGDYEKRNQLRLEKEKSVLETFWSWVDQQKPVRNTQLDKVINYVHNRRDTAETYLEECSICRTTKMSPKG